jgi:hypothetical protein
MLVDVPGGLRVTSSRKVTSSDAAVALLHFRCVKVFRNNQQHDWGERKHIFRDLDVCNTGRKANRSRMVVPDDGINVRKVASA